MRRNLDRPVVQENTVVYLEILKNWVDLLLQGPDPKLCTFGNPND